MDQYFSTASEFGTQTTRTYTVAAGSVAEFTERSMIAVGHVMTTTEKHQGTGIAWQGVHEYLNATCLLAEEKKVTQVNRINKFLLNFHFKHPQDPYKGDSPLQFVFPECP